MNTENLYFGESDDGENWWSIARSENEAREEIADRLGDDYPDGLSVQRVDPARILGQHTMTVRKCGWTVRTISRAPLADVCVFNIIVQHHADPTEMLQQVGELCCAYLWHHEDTGWCTYIDGGEYRDSVRALVLRLAHFDALDTGIHANEV